MNPDENGAASVSNATASSGKQQPTKHLPNRSTRAQDRYAYSKRNSGGCVILGWSCALQDISSQASRISALRLIASGK
jgi:hypothetical protein